MNGLLAGSMASAKRSLLDALIRPGKRRNRFATHLANICVNYLATYENCSWNMASNGELELLKRLSRARVEVIFDVGAHEGDWSRTALRHCAEAVIHAFEIAPETAQSLHSTLGKDKRVVVNRFGLGETDQEVRLAYFPAHDDNTRILSSAQTAPADAVHVGARIVNGDDYCRSSGIGRIDFLKIDVEGHEYPVLKGFQAMLSAGAIDVIQFEHVHDFMLRGQYCLEDLFSLLTSHGYRIGRLFPQGVLAQPYDGALERLPFANYVAVCGARPRLWQVLEYR